MPLAAQLLSPRSDVIGIMEVQVQAGQTTAIAPIFHKGAQATGQVTAREGDHQLKVDWFDGTLNDFDTTWWKTLSSANTAWAGQALYGSWIEESESWAFSNNLNDPVFQNYFPLSIGETVHMMPFWTLSEWIGLPDEGGYQTERVSSAGMDLFSFIDETGDSHWGWIAPDEEQPILADDLALTSRDQLLEYVRMPGTSAKTLVFTGVARTGLQKTKIIPSAAPYWQPIFRLDGKTWSLKDFHTAYVKTNPSLSFVGGSKPENADHFRILDATGNWQEYYYQTAVAKTTTTPAIVAGWRRWLINRWVVLTAAELTKVTMPVHSGFQVWRPLVVSNTELSFTFPALTNTTKQKVAGLTGAGTKFKDTTYTKVIVDRNKNGLPDGWEDQWFPPPPLPLVAKKILATDDPDLDGYDNFHEFLFGGNPLEFDAPGRPMVQVQRATSKSNPSYVISFKAPPQFQFIIQRRLGIEKDFLTFAKVVADSEGQVLFTDTSYASEKYHSTPRFYRVLAYAPIDTDADGVSDYEELSYYGTRFDKKDTDGDGMSDGAELEAGRDPADYFDNRLASFTMAKFSNGQFAAPGDWLQRPIEVKLTLKSAGSATKKPLANAPVTFVMTHGEAVFSAEPRGRAASDGTPSLLSPSISVRTNAHGIARVWVYISPNMTESSLQGRATALMQDVQQANSNILVDNLYSLNFIAYSAPALTMPAGDVVAWFRADSGLVNQESGVRAWKDSLGGDFTAHVDQYIDGQFRSRPFSELQISSTSKSLSWDAARSWIMFDGRSRFVFAPALPKADYSCFLVAQPSEKTGAGVTGDELKNVSADWKKWVSKLT